MLKKSEVEPKVQELFKVMTGKGVAPLSASAQQALSLQLELLASTLEAVHSIADSLATIARAKRAEQGWPSSD